MGPSVEEPYLDAWRALLNAHARLTARIDADLAAAGLPPLSWYDVLWPLYRAPDRRLRMGALAASVVTISRTGLSRLVDRIEAAGLLRRRPAAGDRRGIEIEITDDGAAMLRQMWPVYARVLREYVAARLTESEARRLRDALERVGIGQDQGGQPNRRRLLQ
jgi:DNA-binding MarR family transcriptional regulator